MENDKQDWGNAYKQLADLITTKVPEIKHVDMYHEQEQLIDESGEWIPFPAPAVFLEFVFSATDLAEGRQLLNVEVIVRLAVETLDDTHKGSIGRDRAMKFIDLMRKIHEALHNAEGDDFGPMSRTGMQKHASPPYMMLYSQTYATTILDYGGTRNYDEVEDIPLQIEPRGGPAGAPSQLVVVRNSDNSYSVEIEAPGTVLLPNVTHTDSNGAAVVRPAMVPFVATQCGTPQPAQLYDSESNLIALIPSGGSAFVPSGALYFEDASGVMQQITGVPLVLVGDQLFLQWSPDRFIVFKSNGTTIYATRDVLTPMIIMPKQPVRNSLGTQISEHEVGDPGYGGDSMITRPDGTTFALPATVPFDIRVLRSGIVYDFGQMLHTGQLTVFRAGDEASLHAAGWFNYTPPPYPLNYASLASFNTLLETNVHGNTLRFTDRSGAAAATSGDRIIQDHLTGLEWYLASTLLTGTWTAAIDAAEASTVGGSTDWHLPPEKALETISDYSLGSAALNYAPFNIANNILTGTTYPADTALVRYYTTGGGVTANIAKTSSQRYIFCRRFV